jgi:hypothetical protein
MAPKSYMPRYGFADGIARAGEGVFLRLARNQVAALERLAEAAGKTLKQYLRDIGEAAIEKMIPAEPEKEAAEEHIETKTNTSVNVH